jgi:hypothetical protein
MGRTKGSLLVASREEPGAGLCGGFSTIRWHILAGARRADSRTTLTPTVQRGRERRSWARKWFPAIESYASCIGRMWVSPSIFPML